MAIVNGLECFVIIVNDFQPLTIITKHSILDVSATLDPPLKIKDNSLNIVEVKKFKDTFLQR